MIRNAIAMAAAMTLAACGGAEDGKGKDAPTRKDEVRALDPNPPMSAGDIDSIVKETRERDATRGGGAPAPAAEDASNTTN